MTMMTSPPEAEPAPRKGRAPVWLRIFGGALFGGIAGYGLARLAFSFFPELADRQDIGLAQVGAIALGAIAIIIGVIILAMSVSKRLYESENWTAESDPDEHSRKVPELRLVGVSLLAMGVEFGALAMVPNANNAYFIFALIAASLIVQGWTGWRLWQAQDELERAVTLEASAISLGAVFLLLSMWVPLAIYGFVGFDPLAVILLVTLTMLVPTIWLTVKRGLTA